MDGSERKREERGGRAEEERSSREAAAPPAQPPAAKTTPDTSTDTEEDREELTDFIVEESFPASDPPAYTVVREALEKTERNTPSGNAGCNDPGRKRSDR